MTMLNWELIELDDELDLGVDTFEFACCGNALVCGGGTKD